MKATPTTGTPLLLLGAIFLWTSVASALDIVVDRRAATAIVVPENAIRVEEFAARELQCHG